MTHPNLDIKQLQTELNGKSPRAILRRAFALFPSVSFAFSGAEDVILIDMAHQLKLPLEVFTLDTGRLHPETYRFIEQVRTHYKIDIELLVPDTVALEAFVKTRGLFSFYEEGHQPCCAIRKVEPLRRKLRSVDAWMSGQRKDQSNETRQALPEVQQDPAFSTDEHTLVKFNPLTNWSSAQVWDYIEAYQVPFNELHSRGFPSIGCEPCTRPIRPHQHQREGRWWWENASKKECGMHRSQ